MEGAWLLDNDDAVNMWTNICCLPDMLQIKKQKKKKKKASKLKVKGWKYMYIMQV